MLKFFKIITVLCVLALVCAAPGVAQARSLVPVAPLALVGSNFRISQNTATTDSSAVANPAAAFNTTNSEFLVVWKGLEFVAGYEYEIYGQRITAAGTETGTSDFQISTNPTDDGYDYSGEPAVAYNSTNNEYMVIWAGDQTTAYDYDIYGQRISNTGALLGSNFSISSMSVAYPGAVNPALAYNPTNNEYLVVWAGYDTLGGIGNAEIYGQRVSNTGTLTGSVFRLSDMGVDGDPDGVHEATNPAVAFDISNNQYLVVWEGDDADTTADTINRTEIYGQLVSNTGVEVALNDFKISDMGATATDNFTAKTPDVTFNTSKSEFLVVWSGEGTGTDEEYEIYSQVVSASGSNVGTDLRISDMGPDGSISYNAVNPAVDYAASNAGYFVTWSGDDNTDSMVDEEFEIFGQYINNSGAESGADFQVSSTASNGNANYDSETPDVVYDQISNQAFVVWAGDDTTVANEDYEVYGQLDSTPTAVVVESFTSTISSTDAIRLTWNTTSQVSLIGFNVYRSAPGQPETQLNATLISAQSEVTEYLDAEVEIGVTYTYWLEVVDAQGNTTRVGSIEASLGSRIFLPLTRR